MAIDNYTANKSFIFEHKERTPRWISFFNLLFAIGTIIILMVAFAFFICSRSHEYAFTEEEKRIIIFFVIWICFAFFLAVLNGCVERFDFYYIVTVDENSFTIGIPSKGYVCTRRFLRKTEYQFKEKSRLVYIRDDLGHRVGFRYDEPFRKFLEEIQIK